MAEFRGRQRSFDKEGRNTSSSDPKMIRSRIFVGNLTDQVTRQDIEKAFKKYGTILGVSLHKNFGFVQFDSQESADKAVTEEEDTTIHGHKVEVNIVTERMKEQSGGRRRPGRSMSPRTSRLNRDRDMDFRSRRHRSPPPPPPSRFRGPPDRFRDPYLPPPPPPPLRGGYMDDLHDDPYDMYPPEPPPPPFMRGPPPPPPPPRRPPFGSPEFLPPPRRERFGMDYFDEMERDRMREREPHSPPRPLPPPPPPRPPSLPPQERNRPHMEIIVVNRQQREYAESVRQKTESLGLNVNIVQLSLTVSLTAAMENAAQRGLLYTVIITSQHEAHNSITLTILRGRNPQEHKNMPLGDALGLIERDFSNYCYGPRRDSLPPPPPSHASARPSAAGGGLGPQSHTSVTDLMSRAASGEQLNSSELSMLISSLQQQQAKPPSPARPVSTHDVGSSFSQSADNNIQRQQADLQAKILSLLGSSAVVPAAKPAPTHSPSTSGKASYPASRYGGGGGGGGGGRTEDTSYGDYSFADRYRQPAYGGYH